MWSLRKDSYESMNIKVMNVTVLQINLYKLIKHK